MSSKNQRRKIQRYGSDNTTAFNELVNTTNPDLDTANLAVARQIISVFPSIKDSVKLTVQSMLGKSDHPSLIVLQYMDQERNPSSNSLRREIEQAIKYEEFNTLDVVIATLDANLPSPSKVVVAKLLTRSQAVDMRLGRKHDIDGLPFLAFIACSRISNMSTQINVPFGLR